MTTPATPTATRFCDIVSPLVGGRCYPGVIRRGAEPELPVVLYYMGSPEQLQTFGGTSSVGHTLRYEIHGSTYEGVLGLYDRIQAELQPLLLRTGSGLEDYDDDLKVYRRIQGVTLR